MMSLMVIILPVCAFLVLNKNLFRDRPSEKAVSRRRLYAVSIAAALIVGVYDGFYGPGTGTFLIIAFNIFAGMDVRKANGQTKIINLTTNVTSLVIFLVSGQVAVYLGLAAAACNMLGGYIGAGMMMEKGTKIVRPSIILVLLLLSIKIISGLFSFG